MANWIRRRHQTVSLKLNCPSPTCEHHTGEGFRREEELEGHVRLKHPRLSFESLAEDASIPTAKWNLHNV
jgi:hypothetical protein